MAAASDPKAELRQLLADKLLARWIEEGYAGNVSGDLPYEGQCEQIAGWVTDLLTVEEDYQSIDTSRLCEPNGSAMWQRRLVAKTDWQASDGPDPARALLRANGIDPNNVLAHPGPEVDVVARTITVHHVIPGTLGAESLRRTYPMTVMPDALT